MRKTLKYAKLILIILTKKYKSIETIIPELSDIFISDFEIFNNYLVTIINNKNKKSLNIFNIEKNKICDEIKFTDEFYEINFHNNINLDEKNFQFTYTTLHTPEETYKYNFFEKSKTLLKTIKVPNFKKDDYKIERIYVKSRDGKMIPLSILCKKNLSIDFSKVNMQNKTFPTLIYVYGAYGSNISLNFSNSIFSLVDRGFIYAIAHVRGGKELGQDWYDDGRLLNKKNTFFDLIDCGEWFINNKYSTKKQLCTLGGSAGGLTVTASMNMKPDLFQSIVAAVPFVDVVSTMLDKNIPLTTNEYHEWGNPNIKKYYDYMLSYSPYDNIKGDVEYPHILLTTALHDSQVQYWEASKMLAKLKEISREKNLCLLKSDLSSGHSGHSDRFLYYKEIAYIYRFFLYTLNLK
jgi:oligopeptidase B